MENYIIKSLLGLFCLFFCIYSLFAISVIVHKRPVLKKAIIIFFGILLLIVGLYSWDFTRNRILIYTQTPCRTFISPDGQFNLTVYDFWWQFLVKTDDRTGFVILRDKKGNILNSCIAQDVFSADNPYWADKNTDDYRKAHVHISCVLDWYLPEKENNPSK